jgi:hypothetical protein
VDDIDALLRGENVEEPADDTDLDRDDRGRLRTDRKDRDPSPERRTRRRSSQES